MVATLFVVGICGQHPVLDGLDLPRHGLIDAQDMQPQPRSQKAHQGGGGVGHGGALRPQHDDLLHKLLVHAAVAFHMARIHAECLHQRFFFLEVMLGVGQQAGIGIGQHHFTIAALGEQAPAEFIEQVHQRMVLLIHGIQVRDEMLIPYKCGVHDQCLG